MIARIIYNPTSGKENFVKKLHIVIEVLSEKGYIVEVYPTKDEKDATRIAGISADEQIDMLVVSGGDGTLHEVINGIASKPSRPTLAYIPSGTTNDFAKSLGIPTDSKSIRSYFEDGVRTKIDIGQVNDMYFINVAAFGAFTQVTYTTPSKLKTQLGHLAYIFSSIGEIPKFVTSNTNVSIKTDEYEFEKEASVFLIANSTSVGGFKNLLPGAKINDGLLDVIVVNSKNIMLLKELIDTYSTSNNSSIDNDGFAYFTAERIQIKSDDKLIWNFDGELGHKGDLDVRCLKQHIEMLVPSDSKIIDWRGEK